MAVAAPVLFHGCSELRGSGDHPHVYARGCQAGVEWVPVVGESAVAGQRELILDVLACCKVPALLAHLAFILTFVFDVSGLPAGHI